jgi:hypothetical protein
MQDTQIYFCIGPRNILNRPCCRATSCIGFTVFRYVTLHVDYIVNESPLSMSYQIVTQVIASSLESYRNRLHSILNVLQIFISRWEIQTYWDCSSVGATVLP